MADLLGKVQLSQEQNVPASLPHFTPPGVDDIHRDELFSNKRMLEYWLRRHYDPQSERHTGTDALLTLLDGGWQPVEYVIKQHIALMGGKSCCYHFQLECPADARDRAAGTVDAASDTLNLTIVYNPAVERVINTLGLRVVAHEMMIDEAREALGIHAPG